MLSATGRELSRHWLAIIALIWSGQAISMFTSYAASFAAIWYVTESTGSALALALLSICAYLPQGLLSPFGGVVADRINRKYIVIVADLFTGIASLVLGLIILFGHVSLGALVIMVIVRSAGQAFHYPAMMALMPMLVPEKHLLRINTLDQLLLSVAGMVAPALGILLYTVLGFHSVMFLDFVGALLACTTMLLAKVPSSQNQAGSNASASADEDPSAPAPAKRHVLHDLKEGWVALRSVRGLFMLIVLITLGMVCYSPMSSLYPLMTYEHFQGDGYMASIAEATFAAGLLIGSTILMVWGGGKRLTLLIASACLFFGVLCSVSGLLHPSLFWVFAALCAGMGLVSAWFNGPMMTLIQRNSTEETMGRIIGLVTAASALAGPFGIALGGVFAEFAGVALFFVVDGVLCAFLGVLIVSFKSIRALDK